MRGSMRATHILRYFPNLHDAQCSHNHITLSFLLTEAHLVQSHFLQKKKVHHLLSSLFSLAFFSSYSLYPFSHVNTHRTSPSFIEAHNKIEISLDLFLIGSSEHEALNTHHYFCISLLQIHLSKLSMSLPPYNYNTGQAILYLSV